MGICEKLVAAKRRSGSRGVDRQFRIKAAQHSLNEASTWTIGRRSSEHLIDKVRESSWPIAVPPVQRIRATLSVNLHSLLHVAARIGQLARQQFEQGDAKTEDVGRWTVDFRLVAKL